MGKQGQENLDYWLDLEADGGLAEPERRELVAALAEAPAVAVAERRRQGCNAQRRRQGLISTPVRAKPQ